MPTGIYQRKKRNVAARFWKLVDRRDEHECWEWKGYVNQSGYGRFWFNDRLCQASHVSLYLAGIHLPEKPIVMHSCDNPPCVNPKHLMLGSKKDNANDMVAKGRHNPKRGEQSHFAKLNITQVIEIRQAREKGALLKNLASKFNVSETAICNIVNRKTWK